VRYRNIYPGVDLRYYGDGNSLKYDFIVQPGADPCLIEIEYDGVNYLSINAQGGLVVSTQFGDVIERAPCVYQEIRSNKREIPCSYVIVDRDRFGFLLEGDYDGTQLLYIDPELSYSTYLGGSNSDVDYGIAMDGEGNTYLTGYTVSTNFPTANPYDGSFNGVLDVFVTKLSASGDSLLYSTYLGGSDWDLGSGIAVDGQGNAYVTGVTRSTDFPMADPYDTTYNGVYDAFAIKLSTSGDSLLYSTYLGGSDWDWGFGIAVDSQGNAYVTGYTYSPNFPTASAYQGSYNDWGDVFVTKLSTSGDSLLYSTYLGGSDLDCGFGVAVDGQGNAHVSGWTLSPDFPIANPYQGENNGRADVFVTKLSVSGGSLLYSTYLGGSNDDGGWHVQEYDQYYINVGPTIAVDISGNAYVTGGTSVLSILI